ncbi:hypothetical protein FF2_005889 [Malus domestica]
MMNLCKLLSSKNPQLLITFVITEEWHGFIESDPKPDNIRLATIPNVIPFEHSCAKDFAAFCKRKSIFSWLIYNIIMLYDVKCYVKIAERGDEIVEYIPGVSTTSLQIYLQRFLQTIKMSSPRPLKQLLK